MRLFIAFSVVWPMWLALSDADEPKVFCYYDSKAFGKIGYERMDISRADPSLCTHMVYLSVGITDDDDVLVLNPKFDLPDNQGKAGFKKINALRNRNKKLKTLISTGYRRTGTSNFSWIIMNPSRLSKYVKNVVDFLLRYEFDGLDLRSQFLWSKTQDPPDYYFLFLKELRASFDEHRLILTIGLEGYESFAETYYDIPRIAAYADFVILHMSYPSNARADHHSALHPKSKDVSPVARSRNMIAIVRYWLQQGAPAEKIILGTKFHGERWYLDKSVELERGPQAIAQKDDLVSAVDYLSYTEILLLTSTEGWTSGWDEEQRVPYSSGVGQWISYDNPRSLIEKAKYARAIGLGGVMAWTIDQDDHRGESGERSPLLKALNRGLYETPGNTTL